MSKSKFVIKSIEWAQKKGFSNIKTELVDGFEKPINFTRSGDNVSFAPDMTAFNGQRKHYFHVVQKADEGRKMFTRIALFHSLAKAKDSKLFLMAPMGNLKYARELSKQLPLAEVVRI